MSAAARVDLKTLRINRGFSRRGLARHLDIHESSLSRLESVPPKTVHPSIAKKVADWADCQVTDIMPVEVTS